MFLFGINKAPLHWLLTILVLSEIACSPFSNCHTLALSLLQPCSVIQLYCPMPLRLNSFPPFANTQGRDGEMCFLNERRGGKSPSCPKNHRRPARAAATGLSAKAAKVPQEGSVCQLKQGSFSSLWAVSRPCGPALGFLRAQCSWRTLNKGNANVTATVNLRGCSCQQDIPNQSRNNPT